jgi:hypothetical protein
MSIPLWMLLLATSLGQAPDPATPSAHAASAEKVHAALQRLSVAILALEGNKAALDDAPGVTSILASTLAESPRLKVITQAEITALLGIERQKLLVQGACSESCMAELSGALGSQYLVAGRLDRFGEKYVLTTTVFDSQKALSLAKPKSEVPGQHDLPRAASSMASEIRLALGDTPEAPSLAGSSGRFSVSLKAGSNFLAGLTALAPSGDVEVGFRFAPEWMALVQVGFAFYQTGEGTSVSSVSLLPSLIGVRKLHFIDGAFQPYWGVGLGIQLSLGALGIFQQTGPLPSLWALGGFQYMFFPNFGVLLEGKSNIAQTILGIAGATESRGFNIDLTAGATFRF